MEMDHRWVSAFSFFFRDGWLCMGVKTDRRHSLIHNPNRRSSRLNGTLKTHGSWNSIFLLREDRWGSCNFQASILDFMLYIEKVLVRLQAISNGLLSFGWKYVFGLSYDECRNIYKVFSQGNKQKVRQPILLTEITGLETTRKSERKTKNIRIDKGFKSFPWKAENLYYAAVSFCNLPRHVHLLLHKRWVFILFDFFLIPVDSF